MGYTLVLATCLSLLVNTACSEHPNPSNGRQSPHEAGTAVADTLEFTSGIRSILHDSQGNYWFGSDQEGVCKFDGAKFQYFTPEDGFCGKQVITIQEDKSGRIWFGTSSGVCYYDGKRFHEVATAAPAQLLGEPAQSAWLVRTTDLYFPGRRKNELIRIDQGKAQSLHFTSPPPEKGKPLDYGITAIVKSKRGGLWMAHYAGVSYTDGTNFRWINDKSMHFDGVSKYMHVRSILEDSKGRLWIGNNGIGVQLLEGDSIVHFSEKMGLFKGDIFAFPGLPSTLMHVFAIAEDANGTIWFGDRDTGVWRYDGTAMKNFTLDAKLATNHIWQIYEDKKGQLLFASGDRGVYQWNGADFDRVF